MPAIVVDPGDAAAGIGAVAPEPLAVQAGERRGEGAVRSAGGERGGRGQGGEGGHGDNESIGANPGVLEKMLAARARRAERAGAGRGRQRAAERSGAGQGFFTSDFTAQVLRPSGR